MKGVAPPALIPVTLQPWHGSAITVQSDAYRSPEAQAQTTLFSSGRLDPAETYTITITKTNATFSVDLNIDAFILTQLDGADSPFPPGTSFSVSAPVSNIPSSPFVAPTIVTGDTTLTGPVVSLWVPDATSIADGAFTQTSSISNADSSNTSRSQAQLSLEG